jgi:hypothetical protein
MKVIGRPLFLFLSRTVAQSSANNSTSLAAL